MDERILKIPTPERCEIFAENALAKNRPELALEARQRAIQLRAEIGAEKYGAETDVEKECLQVVYAYEQVLSANRGKSIRASRTWQMFKRHGIIDAVEKAVNRKQDPTGYLALVEIGMEEYTFEAVIVKYPKSFTPDVVDISNRRLAERKAL